MRQRVQEFGGYTEVGIASGEQDRIHRRPPAHVRIVVPRPEPHKTGVGVVDAPRKPERLEARASIGSIAYRRALA